MDFEEFYFNFNYIYSNFHYNIKTFIDFQIYSKFLNFDFWSANFLNLVFGSFKIFPDVSLIPSVHFPSTHSFDHSGLSKTNDDIILLFLGQKPLFSGTKLGRRLRLKFPRQPALSCFHNSSSISMNCLFVEKNRWWLFDIDECFCIKE